MLLSLAGFNFKDPAEGYAKYIDVDSFIDFFIMSEITKNVDANGSVHTSIKKIPMEVSLHGPI
jgi:hypothetical protein